MLKLCLDSSIWEFGCAAANHDYSHIDVYFHWIQAFRKEKIMLCVSWMNAQAEGKVF